MNHFATSVHFPCRHRKNTVREITGTEQSRPFSVQANWTPETAVLLLWNPFVSSFSFSLPHFLLNTDAWRSAVPGEERPSGFATGCRWASSLRWTNQTFQIKQRVLWSAESFIVHFFFNLPWLTTFCERVARSQLWLHCNFRTTGSRCWGGPSFTAPRWEDVFAVKQAPWTGRSGMSRAGDSNHGKTADVSLDSRSSLDSAKCWVSSVFFSSLFLNLMCWCVSSHDSALN